MSILAQALRICAVACVCAVVSFAVHGMPRAASEGNPGETGACRAPDTASTNTVEPGVRWIGQEDAKALAGQAGVVFVDCRPRGQFEAGHVTGAIHLEPPRPDAVAGLPPERVEELRAARIVITYCDAQAQCERSFQLAQLLSRAGLTDVRVLEDGMPMWMQRGYPAESGTCQQCESD